MICMTKRQWVVVYHALWKPRIAHLPNERRAKLARGCMGKVMYDTKEQAEQVAAALTPRPGFDCHGYRCPLCESFHVGNSRRSGRLKADLTARTPLVR